VVLAAGAWYLRRHLLRRREAQYETDVGRPCRPTLLGTIQTDLTRLRSLFKKTMAAMSTRLSGILPKKQPSPVKEEDAEVEASSLRTTMRKTLISLRSRLSGIFSRKQPSPFEGGERHSNILNPLASGSQPNLMLRNNPIFAMEEGGGEAPRLSQEWSDEEESQPFDGEGFDGQDTPAQQERNTASIIANEDIHMFQMDQERGGQSGSESPMPANNNPDLEAGQQIDKVNGLKP
jgi:hypothetical protein